MAQSTRSAESPHVLADNVAGTMAYLTIIPAILFLWIDPYQRNRSVRFHAWQCIFLTLAWCTVELILGILALIDPFLGTLLGGLDSLFSLAVLVVWIMLMIKTINGERYKLPLIGERAERKANA